MSIEQRLDHLERRLRVAEDHLAILNLLNSYGPLVDSGTSVPAADLWVDGGGYNFSGGFSGGTRIVAPQDLVAMYESDGHKALVNAGCSHLTATPHIAVDGDDAVAVGYSYVVLKEGERWYLWRAAINRWTLTRTPDGWRITERVNRVLDGSEESHDLMRQVLG